MPIYAYRCAACGHAQDVLQKMSDPLLTVCPACGAAALQKQVTAAGFQLKGSGWYVTDFRGDGKAPKKADDQAGEGASRSDAPAAAGESKDGASTKSGEGSATASGGDKPAAATAAPSPSAAPAPAASPSSSDSKP